MHLPTVLTRTFSLSLCALAVACTTGARAQTTPEAVARQWVDAFNAGDMAKVDALNAKSGASIIDEFAPFTWTGPKAFADWGAGFDADAKARGITEARVTLGPLLAKNITPTEAYLTCTAVYTYKLKGVPRRENGYDALVLRKEADGWKMVSWAWLARISKPVK